jgi:hypothetical protein
MLEDDSGYFSESSLILFHFKEILKLIIKTIKKLIIKITQKYIKKTLIVIIISSFLYLLGFYGKYSGFLILDLYLNFAYNFITIL